ncbi:hypothetical protein P154DRAFT_531557 [Amniculicola lignicola CBS 123094]|uniref:Uncharacterized protein n=1 Tax=Amniculicola lignicola CBS 123094 TaxID=1392246 RepID=A0A6A5WYS9_9PLEO|nr:hypothetical protein P154DRAFT_531557 [Amniculicola lignicola CBS 123094]
MGDAKRTKLESLPNELLIQIATHLSIPPPSITKFAHEPSSLLPFSPTTSLKSLSLVSWRWRKLVLPILFRYSHVQIDNTAQWIPVDARLIEDMQGNLTSLSDHEMRIYTKMRTRFKSSSMFAFEESFDDLLINLCRIQEGDAFLQNVPTTLWLPHLPSSFLDFGAFVEKFGLKHHVKSVVVWSDLEYGLRHLATADAPLARSVGEIWNLVFNILAPERVVVAAPPTTLAGLLDTQMLSSDTWAFDMKMHYIELSTIPPSTSCSTSTPSKPKHTPAPTCRPKDTTALIHRAPWHHISYNEGSSIPAYSTYEYHLKQSPKMLYLLLLRIAQEVEPCCCPTSLSFTSIFPFSTNVTTLIRAMALLPTLEELSVQLAPGLENTVLGDKGKLGRAQASDLWLEWNESYKHVASFLRSGVFGRGARFRNSDDASVTRREAYYNQQRSSLRSDRSSRPASQRQSAQPLQTFLMPDDSVLDEEDASPSPVIPLSRPRSQEDVVVVAAAAKKKRYSARSAGSVSSRQSPRDARTPSRGRNIDQFLMVDSQDNLTDAGAPPPIRNPRQNNSSFYRHTTPEDPRGHSRQARSTPLSRIGTPGTIGTDFDITALPPIADEAEKQVPNDHLARKRTPGQRRASRFATELYTASYLILFSILGTLARLGLQWLTFYPGAPVIFSDVWANFGGSLFMGFLVEDRRLFRQEWGKKPHADDSGIEDEESTLESKAAHVRVKKSIPLYIGLATGFCGSFTSFSSFMRDIFFALSNDMPSPLNYPPPSPAPSTASPVPRNGGDSFMAVLAVIIITLTMCYAAFRVGAHIAVYTSRIVPTLSFYAFRRVIDPLLVIIAFGTWIGAIVMSIWPPDRPSGPVSKGPWENETWRGQAVFACVFAPAGCLLRFYGSLFLNPLTPSFPLGTFCVNVFGTAVLGMAYDLQHVSIASSSVIGGGRIGCQVLQGVMDGFCGSLTTVSTWIYELELLKRGHAYVYGFTSVAAGLGILVCVMGSVRWTVGWSEVACVMP